MNDIKFLQQLLEDETIKKIENEVFISIFDLDLGKKLQLQWITDQVYTINNMYYLLSGKYKNYNSFTIIYTHETKEFHFKLKKLWNFLESKGMVSVKFIMIGDDNQIILDIYPSIKKNNDFCLSNILVDLNFNNGDIERLFTIEKLKHIRNTFIPLSIIVKNEHVVDEVIDFLTVSYFNENNILMGVINIKEIGNIQSELIKDHSIIIVHVDEINEQEQEKLACYLSELAENSRNIWPMMVIKKSSTQVISYKLLNLFAKTVSIYLDDVDLTDISYLLMRHNSFLKERNLSIIDAILMNKVFSYVNQNDVKLNLDVKFRQEWDLNTYLSNIELNCLTQALQICQGNKNKTAQLLSIKRTTLIEKLKKYSVSL